jgi:hypothetical protein
MAEKPLTTSGRRAPASPATLSAIACALGALEPRRGDDDLSPLHLDRQAIIFNAAAQMPVCSGGDAALALSAAAAGLDGVMHYELTEAQRNYAIEAAMKSIAAVASWVMAEHGGFPVASAWPSYADPFVRRAGPVS